jgi:phosphatidylglycerophosphate synthase
MRSLRTAVTGCGVLLVVMALAGHAGELPASEQRKIEALMQHVALLTEAVFIRNNQVYPAKTAAQFLRGKWRATLEDITTAQEFIAKIASVSSTTGQPYRIRFPDGHEMRSGDYLRTVLQQLEQSSKP